MNTLASVVVQIIGLAVLRTEPQLGGMHVVLPSVITESSHVEPHSAILVFKDDKRVGGNNWPSFKLKPMPGYSYVKLNGERIRFKVNGTNAPAKIPAVLPHLRQSCSLMRDLSDGYRPPGYRAAAAVVMIPNGASSACRNTNERIDTRVQMVNTGNFQVVGFHKSLTLRDGAVVMIVNLPTAWVEGVKGKKVPSALHSHVYFHMARLASTARGECALQRSQNVDPCNSPRFNPPVAKHPGVIHLAAPIDPSGTPTHPDIGSIPSTTFECSNTQWP